MKGSEFSLEDVRDEIRKMFLKLEQKVYLENTEFKKDAASCFKDLRSDLDNLNKGFATLNEDTESSKNRNEATFKDVHDKFERLESEIRLTKQKCSCADRRLSEFIEKTERIIDDNIHLSGMCGDFSRYKDLRGLLEHLLVSYQNFGISKDKTLFELQNLKERLDSKISLISLKFDSQEKNIRLLYNSKMDSVELSIKSTMDDYNEKLSSIRTECLQSLTEVKSSLKNNYNEHENLNSQIYSLAHRLENVHSLIDEYKALNTSSIDTLHELQISEVIDIRNELSSQAKITKDLQSSIDCLEKSLYKQKGALDKPVVRSSKLIRETEEVDKVNGLKAGHLKPSLKLVNNDLSNFGLPPIVSPANQIKNKLVFQANNKQLRSKLNDNFDSVGLSNDEVAEVDKYFTIDDNVKIDPDFWNLSESPRSSQKKSNHKEYQDLVSKSFVGNNSAYPKKKQFQSSNQLKLMIKSSNNLNSSSGPKSSRAMSTAANNTNLSTNDIEKASKSCGKDMSSFNTKIFKSGIKALEKDEGFLIDNCKVKIFEPPIIN